MKKSSSDSLTKEYREKEEVNGSGVYRVPSVPRGQVVTTNGTKLDLSYLTPRILIGSGPTDGKISRLYRNSIYDIIGYLNGRHGENNWCIYNLRAEKLGYAESLISNSSGILKNFKFLDHTVMPFVRFLECVKSIEEYTNSSAGNTVFVHCKFGKGRTGMIAVGYLMYKYNMKLSDALDLFRIRRNFYDVTVSVSSQLRYLKYFRKMLDNRENMFDKYKKITKENHKILFKSLNFEKLKVDINDFNFPLVDSHETFVRFKIQNFSSKEGDKISEIYTDTIRLKDIEKNSDGIDITVDLNSMNRDENDFLNLQDFSICIEFLNDSRIIAYGNFWFNPINEILNDNLEDGDRKTGIEKSVEVTWDEMDGYKGTKKRGLKLFESVCVKYVVI